MLAFVVRIVEFVVVKRVQFESLNPINNTSTSVFLTWWDCTISLKGNTKKKKKKKKEFIVTQQITWLVPNDKEENWQQNEFLQIILNNSKQVQPESKTDGYFWEPWMMRPSNKQVQTQRVLAVASGPWGCGLVMLGPMALDCCRLALIFWEIGKKGFALIVYCVLISMNRMIRVDPPIGSHP